LKNRVNYNYKIGDVVFFHKFYHEYEYYWDIGIVFSIEERVDYNKYIIKTKCSSYGFVDDLKLNAVLWVPYLVPFEISNKYINLYYELFYNEE
jgi:hypothetical protein